MRVMASKIEIAVAVVNKLLGKVTGGAFDLPATSGVVTSVTGWSYAAMIDFQVSLFELSSIIFVTIPTGLWLWIRIAREIRGVPPPPLIKPAVVAPKAKPEPSTKDAQP